ncbi:centrosomal protein of 131 kDa [Cololabis saira]|uniref:centrosomal protein of 131 kDa n=1 Tax=Cololabis saira TaxID=129043 RepID=UPI002AD2BF12|nr:centrosomal protein of 131 kDa [Cololabis saira]
MYTTWTDVKVSEMMRAARSPASVPSVPPGPGTPDLSLTGTRVPASRRPGSGSGGSPSTGPGRSFSRSVSVAGDGRGKHNTLGDGGVGGSRSSKNLRRSSSSTTVHQQAGSTLSQERPDDYLALLDGGSTGRRKLAGLSKISADRTTWNILDDQPRSPPHHPGPRNAGRKREPGIALAATFTANNRSNKGAVGNAVTTILHNNYSDKPLTPKSSNQRPTFNNILKASVSDEPPPEDDSVSRNSVSRSQKNFSSSSSPSSSRSPATARRRSSPDQPRRTEVSEEEAERFIQQVNRAAVTIQLWYRRLSRRKHADRAAAQQILADRKESGGKQEAGRPEQRRKVEDRKKIREEKARLARLAAIQELHQKREQHQTLETQPDAEAELETQNNTDSGLNLGNLSFRPASPASSNHRGSQSSHPLLSEQQARASGAPGASGASGDDRKLTRKERSRLPPPSSSQQVETQQAGNPRPAANEGSSSVGATLSSSPMPPPDLKTRNKDSGSGVLADSLGDDSPALTNRRGSQSSQHQEAPSRTTLTELLDTLKLLEDESAPPGRYHKEKYAWIDQDGDSTCLTTDNLEWHGTLSHRPVLADRGTLSHHSVLAEHGAPSHRPVLADRGALLSEAKLQSIMSFLDEMEKSEQERPRSPTPGSHREALLSEDDVAGLDHASATAAEVSGSMLRIRMELEEKKRSVSMLQTALAQQRELTERHMRDLETELNRNMQLQKEQYEATIQRHLTFIDQLISDKKTLSQRCEAVVTELKQMDQKSSRKMEQMQQQHQMEIKKLKEVMSASEKIRREKWIDEKTKKIKEVTVKGLEPEIQKLICKHKQELQKLRTLHEADLLQADERAARRYVQQTEELRCQLEREREEQSQREREQAKQRFEKQLQEEQLLLQLQRRRLHQEVNEEKERLATLAARQRSELEDLRQQLEENSSLAGRTLREELDRTRMEQERRHQVEMKVLQERLDLEKQSWEESYKSREEAWMLSREHALKQELRQDRDKEIQRAIWTLEEETSRDKEECDRAAESRVKRIRDKYEAELRELENSTRAAVAKQQELRKQQVETDGEMIRLQAALRQKEQEAEDVTRSRDKLAEERHSLAEVIRQEFAERLVATEEENRQLKTEVSEVRARLRLEVERISREKEEELAEVQQRVKSAVMKKEETVNNLRKQHEAALKRADHLESLWEQQRKQLQHK